MTGRKLLINGGVILAISFAILFVGGGSRNAIGLVLKPMADGLTWERGALGVAIASFLFVSAACTFLAGHLADRFSLRVLLAGGLLIGAAAIGPMGLVSQPWHALVLYGIAFAVGNGAISIVPVGVMVTRRFPNRIGLANAAAISGMGLGQLVIISLLAAVLVSVGWRSVFGWLALINLALIPFVLWALKGEDRPANDPADATAPSARSVGEALRTRYFWHLLALYAVCGFQDFFVGTHVVAFALDSGVAPLLAGNLLAFMGLAGLFGVIAAGAWSDRVGPIGATLVCFALRVVVFALVLIDTGTLPVAVFAVVYGFTFWATAPLTVVFVRNAFGVRNLGALSGIVTMVHQVCGGIGAWVGAINFDAAGSYDGTFMVMGGGAVVAMLLTVGLALLRPGTAPRP